MRGLRPPQVRRAPLIEQGATTCCYAKSEKIWVFDPDGTAWEAFLTTGESSTYGADADLEAGRAARAAVSQFG